jgi:uncharacterized protein
MPFDAKLLMILSALFCVSFLFSSVGHGGASGYLAVLSLASISIAIIKPTALILNVFVSIISFSHYRSQGYFKWKLFYPFIILSIPMAFLGGQIKLEDSVYKMLLGIVLIFVLVKISIRKKDSVKIQEMPFVFAVIIGAIIGFLSGILGIGGGIILSPILLLFRWATIKETAPITALFIFLNSISGLLGFYLKSGGLPQEALFLLPITLIGGFLGSYYGSNKYSNAVLQNILVVVLCVAIFKLIDFY